MIFDKYRNYIPNMRTLICVLGMVCICASCKWQEAKEVIAVADSLDQTEHVIYDDTAALGGVIRRLDNPMGRLLMSNTLSKAYYYMGRNLSLSNHIAKAAECYVAADRLQINDPIYRGRVNSCMGYICAQNNKDSLALIFYERAHLAFEKSENKWYYAHSLLNISQCYIYIRSFTEADSLLQIAKLHLSDSIHARYSKIKGLYFYEQQQYDSSLVCFNQGLSYWQSKEEKCFSYLKIMQSHYFSNEKIDSAVYYAHKIILTSTNPNHLVNAYYCLMQDAKNKNNVELLSTYSHARTDAQKLLRDNMILDAEALPTLEKHLSNPHPLRWIRITIGYLAILSLLSLIGVLIFHLRAHKANREIDTLSVRILHQEAILYREAHYRQLEKRVSKARSKYHIPLNRWQEYQILKEDLSPWLHDWLSALDTLSLSEREKIFCTFSLVFSHLTDVEIAGYMCYDKHSIRTIKNRMLKKIGISASEFPDFLYNISYVE